MICINPLMPVMDAQAQESLQQAWDIALQRDHGILAARFQEQAAQAQQDAARAQGMPKIELDTGYLRLQTEPSAHLSLPAIPALRNVSLPFVQDSSGFGLIEVSVPLITSGRISRGIDAADAAAAARQELTRVALADLKLAIAQSYIAVLRAEHAVEVADSHVNTMRRHADDVHELNSKGYVAKHDVMATEVALANALQLQLQASNALALAHASYNRWLGRPSEAKVTIQDNEPAEEAVNATLEEYIQHAITVRPELGALNQQSKALQAQAASVRAAHLPQVGLMTGYAKNDNRYLTQDKGWYAAVVMKWNLFDGGLTRQQASRLLAESQAVDESAKESQEKISLQVRQAWLNKKEATARRALADKVLTQAEQVSELARERYRNGLANLAEVFDAETRRLQANANRDQARYDLFLADVHLRYASGSLSYKQH